MFTKESMDLKRIAAITEAGAVSGSESPVTRLMKEALTGYADEFEDYVQKLQEIPAHDIESRRGVRTFMALAKEIEPDDQGRFILPKNLKDYAKIDKNVVFAGVGKSIEIWAEEEWDKYFDMSNLDSALAIIGEKYKV